MDEILVLLIPAFLGILLVRLLVLPMRWALRLMLHSAAGFGCLWLLNTVSGFTGICFPINALTVLIAGMAGLPGIGVMAMLAVL